MKIFLFALLAVTILFFAFLVFLLFSKITVSIKAEKEHGQKLKTNLELTFGSGWLKKNINLKQKQKSKKKSNPNSEEKKEDDTKFIDKVKKCYKVFCGFKYAYQKNSHKVHRAVFAKKINLYINFGTGNAAHTGILTGALWAGIYNIISFVSAVITIAQPKIDVVPVYNEKKCSVVCECIINTRLVNLINAVVSIGISYLIFTRKQKNIK